MPENQRQPTLPGELLDYLAREQAPNRIAELLGDLLTPAEVEVLAERWAIARMLHAGHSQRDTAAQLSVSVTTVSRGSRQLKYGSGGFVAAFAAIDGSTVPARRGRRGRTPLAAPTSEA